VRLARFLVVVGLLAALPLVGPSPAGAVTLTARGSLNQVQVWGATSGATLELLDSSNAVVATGVADAQGASIFGVAPEMSDDVPAGTGYTVRQGVDVSDPVDVFTFDYDSPVHPDQSFYDAQVLPVPAYPSSVTTTPAQDDGFGYVTTRDGTQLSVNVLAPVSLPATSPPWPTVINYSGYTPSAPGDGDPVTLLLRAAGFAVVGVNMRGTGCSGGAYSYFDRLQALDGYDVVEAVAAQPWVRQALTGVTGFDSGPDVGMVGISFPGISQLFVGRTNPPSLAAISPLSVLADSYRSTLYPGGILNNGFATGWVNDRENQSEPAGQQWAANRINGVDNPPDATCAANQRLKLQAPPLVSRFTQDLLYAPDPADDLAPEQWVDDIDVPTFIAGAFQDEQTGGRWATMLDDFDPAVLKRAILFNGTHADALTPDVVRDLLEFLDLYVARRAPQLKANLRNGAPEQFAGVFGAPYAFPPWRGITSGYRTQAEYDALPNVVVKWERGAADSPNCVVDVGGDDFAETREACDEPVPNDEGSGAPFARFETTATAWPIPGTTADEWFLQPDGALAEVAPAVPDDESRAWSSWTYDNSRDEVGMFTGGSEDIWSKDAAYDWDQPGEATSLRYVTPELTGTRTYAGSGSVDLWLRSTAADVDLEVTLTEVRPDGSETYLQSGWLRASHRAEEPGSTPLAPRHTHVDPQDLPAGEFVPVRVELFPFTAVVRAESRLAVTIAAPGGNRPFWHFDSLDAPGAVNDIGHSVGRPSHLNLPEVSITVPAEAATRPACGDLRAEPCRTVADSTRPTGVVATIDAGDTAADLDRGIDVTWTAPEVGTPSANHVVGLPGEVEYADDDTDPEHRIAIPVGSPPSTGRAFAVRGDGQTSDASLEVIPAHPFTDVARDAWNIDAVDWVAAWHLADGFPDGTFRNGASVTRAQFVSWLWTMFGRPSGSAPHGFRDVRPNAWMSDALSWAKAEGIVGGLPGNRFAPARAINRAQVAQWLWVASGRPDGAPANGFVDVPVNAWYGPAVDWAKDAGVVAGFAGNRFRPTARATRGQAANWFLATATWRNSSVN
jgi:predicted acyl esterase